MADPLICTDCGQSYMMSASEKVRFQELVKTVQGFQMPKRCPECRKKRRMERVPQRPQASVIPAQATPSVLASPPLATIPDPSPVASPAPVVVAPRVIVEVPAVEAPPEKEEVRFVLATTDFEDLVHGRPVVWQGVRVILADIGFKVMREAIERAEFERAKVFYHKNGSA